MMMICLDEARNGLCGVASMVVKRKGSIVLTALGLRPMVVTHSFRLIKVVPYALLSRLTLTSPSTS